MSVYVCVCFTLTVPSKDQDSSLVLSGELESGEKHLTCSLWPWRTLHSPDCHFHTYRGQQRERNQDSQITFSSSFQYPHKDSQIVAHVSLVKWKQQALHQRAILQTFLGELPASHSILIGPWHWPLMCLCTCYVISNLCPFLTTHTSIACHRLSSSGSRRSGAYPSWLVKSNFKLGPMCVCQIFTGGIHLKYQITIIIRKVFIRSYDMWHPPIIL